MKSKYLVGVEFILVFMLHVSLALAQNDYSGGTGITGTRVSDDLDDNLDDLDNDLIDEIVAENRGQYLALREFFECHNIDRDGDTSQLVASAGNVWYGFATVSANNLFTDSTLLELFDLPPFYDSSWYETHKTYVWADLDYTPEVSLEITDDPRLYRFEGKEDSTFPPYETTGCIIGAQYLHHVGFTYDYDETTQASDRSGGTAFEVDSSIGQLIIPTIGETAYEVYSTFNKNIVWDEDSNDCTIIGGAWLDTSNYDDNQGNYYQCCGDDYLWVNNRFVTEEETGQEMDIEYDLETIDMDDEDALRALAEKYCLYSKDENENLLFDYDNCLPTEFHDYDEALDFADEWSADYPDECLDEEENILSTCSYVTTPFYDELTDLGKWSAMEYDGTTSNPNLCRIKEVDDGVPQFAWENVSTAGNLPVDIEGKITDLQEDHAKTICEAYLGGVKTGAYCCGNKYDYDAEFLDEAGYYNESFSDETPIYWNPDKPEEGSYANYACVDGSAIDTKQTAWKKGTDEQQYELLNVGGNLSSCAVENPSILGDDYYKKSPLVEDDSDYDVTACDVVEGQLCSYNPDAEDNQYPWQWEDRTTSSYVRDTLLYSEGDFFTLSTAKWASNEGYEQESACCAGNACWDGDACVPAPTFYYYGEDVDNNGLDDEVAICSAGNWQYPTEPKYDWYHNTDAEAVTYCAYPYACVCSSNEDDETFCTENDAYLEAGCTLVDGFYKDDHFCEALDTDSDGSYDSSQWTSRTKFLAFQLLDIAETERTSFTIFCDKYADAINNYAILEPVEEDINSVCVLEQEGKVTLGITLNSEDDDPMAVDANEFLFDSGSKSIVPNVLEEDAVDNCNAAIIYESGERFGEFYSCDNSITTWYNNNLSALIYSKDGLDYTTIIDYPDINDRQNDFDAYKETITTHITDASDDGTLVNPDGTPLSTYFAEFNTIQDYSSLYYNYNADSGNTIFGFQEIKYSENAADNRYYTAVLYNGYALDCDQVYAPYDTALPVYCNSEGIVLERSTSGSEYWNDLTAAIRLE